jgi:hypothetical protein
VHEAFWTPARHDEKKNPTIHHNSNVKSNDQLKDTENFPWKTSAHKQR